MKKMLPLLAFTLFALGSVAFAQQTPCPSCGREIPDVGGGSPLGGILGVVLSVAGTILSGVLVKGLQFLSAKTAAVKNEKLRGVLDLVAQLAFQKVRQLFQEAIEALKLASADGKLTPEEAKAAGATAVKELWEALPEVAKAILIAVTGSAEQAKATYLKPAVEQAVGSQPPVASSRTIRIGIGSDAAPARGVDPRVAAAAVAARARIGLSR